MIKVKLKTCFGCGEESYIWKNLNGRKYCRGCAYKLENYSTSTGDNITNHSPAPDVKSNKKKSPKRPVKDIPGISKKRVVQMREYRKVRDQYMAEHPECEARVEGVCSFVSTQLHHKAGRSGDMLTNTDYFMAICAECHEWAHHIDDASARELGLLLSRIKKTN